MYNDNRPKPRRRRTSNYDPVYILWKNSFENVYVRSPRKIPPIIGKNKCDITGFLTGQRTPKGFPYYTTHRKCMGYDMEFSDDEEISEKKLKMSPLRFKEDGSQKSMVLAPSTSIVPDANINEGYEAVLSNSNNEIQKEICMKDIAEVLPEDKSRNIQASFICKTSEEQPLTSENLLVHPEQQNAEKTTLKKQPKRLICKNYRRGSSDWESKVQQRRFIDLHDLGGCHYIF